jgi:hypothetical protein
MKDIAYNYEVAKAIGLPFKLTPRAMRRTFRRPDRSAPSDAPRPGPSRVITRGI